MIRMVFLLFWILIAAVSAQDIIDIAVRGISDTNKDGAQKDRLEAIMDAKRQACEKAGLRIQSMTTVENFQTTYDLVESQSEAVLLPGFQVIDNGYGADGTYSVVLVGKVKVVKNMIPVKEISAASVALRNQALKVSTEDKKFYWAALLEKDDRKDLLQQSLLLGLEAYKRSPGEETENNIRQTICLLSEPVARFEFMDGVNDLSFSPEGKFLAAASDDAAAVILDWASNKSIMRFEHENEISELVYSPDGLFLATAGRDSLVNLWNVKNKSRVAQLQHRGPVNILEYSPDGKRIASASSADSGLILWDTATGEIAQKILHNSERIRQVVFSSNGKYFATIAGDVSYSNSENYSACLWSTGSGELIMKVAHERTQKKSMTGIEAIDISPDSKILVTASDDNSVRLWEIPSGKEIHKLRHRSAVIDVAFGQGGSRLVSASRDQTARVWNVNSGEEILKVVHGDILRTARLSPDEKYLASGSLDRTARVYDISTGREMFRMVHRDAVNMVAFSPDGKYLVTGPQSWDRYLKLWNLFPDNIAKEACRLLTRNLSPEEWKKYFGDEAYTKTCPNLP